MNKEIHYNLIRLLAKTDDLKIYLKNNENIDDKIDNIKLFIRELMEKYNE